MRISDWSSDVCSSDLSKSGGEARIGFSNGDTGRLPASSAGMRYRKTGGSAFSAMRPGQLIVVKSTGGDRYALRNLPEVSGGMGVERPPSGTSAEGRVGRGWGGTCRDRWSRAL